MAREKERGNGLERKERRGKGSLIFSSCSGLWRAAATVKELQRKWRREEEENESGGRGRGKWLLQENSRFSSTQL